MASRWPSSRCRHFWRWLHSQDAVDADGGQRIPVRHAASDTGGRHMIRLGKRHLQFRRGLGDGVAVIVPNVYYRRLCDLGLMKARGDDRSFAAITPAGLRALADAAEAGRIELFKMPDRQLK